VIVILLIVPFYMFSQRELAPAEDQGVVFGVIQGSANSTIDQTNLFTTQVYDVYHSFPESESVFQITSPTGGFGGMVTKPWSQRKKTAQQLLVESVGPLSKIPGIRVIPLTPPPLPGGGNFPVEFVITSSMEPRQLDTFAKQLVGKAFASGLFIFADSDLKFDQPQTEVVFDRDKLRSQGVDLTQAGQDLSTMLGGDYVNRFSIQGRSYKVIPQIKRAERLTPEQLEKIYVKGSDNKLVPLSTFAKLKTTTEPRELKKFQQLNAVTIQGVIPPNVPLDNAAAGIHRGLRWRVAPAARRGQQISWDLPAVGGPDLFGAGGAIRELSRSVHHFDGLSAAGHFRRADVFLPGAHHAQHLQSGRANHAGWSRVEKRHPDCGVCQPSPGDRPEQARRGHRSGYNQATPHPDDDRGHRGWSHSAGPGDGPRSRSAKQHRHHAGERHDHRNAVHLVRRAIDLCARGSDARVSGEDGLRVGEHAPRTRRGCCLAGC
jgi:hypothetical protein